MQYLRVFLTVIFLIAGACSTPLLDRQISRVKQILRHGHLAIPPGQLLVGNIETATHATELKVQRESELALAGWAAFTNFHDSISRLDIMIDGNEIGNVQEFSFRPDMAGAYDRPDFEASGWQTTLYLTGIEPGKLYCWYVQLLGTATSRTCLR